MPVFLTIHSITYRANGPGPCTRQKKSSEWEWGPLTRWMIAIWVGRFTHLNKWGNAARRRGHDHSTNKTSLPRQFLNFHLPPALFGFPQYINLILTSWIFEYFHSVWYSYIVLCVLKIIGIGLGHTICTYMYLIRTLFQTPRFFWGRIKSIWAPR